MGILKKNSKEEYWFVPNSNDSLQVSQDDQSTKKSPKKTSAEASSTSKSIKIKKAAEAPKKSTSTATKANAIKASTAKETKKAPTVKEQKKASVSKPAVKSDSTKSTKKATATTTKTTQAAPKKAESVKKPTSKSTEKVSAKSAGKAIAKPATKISAAKKATKSKAKNDSGIVTLITTEEIPKTLYYDEDESEKIAKDVAGEKIEVSGFPGMFEIKKSRDDRYVFNLYAANHVIIATSQIYTSSKNAQVGINSVITNAERANVEDQTLKSFDTVPFPKWEIYIDKGGQYRFRLSASNGSCICHSQGYTTKASCKNGIESIIRTVKSAKIDKSYLK